MRIYARWFVGHSYVFLFFAQLVRNAPMHNGKMNAIMPAIVEMASVIATSDSKDTNVKWNVSMPQT